jgi:hypothetical protein
MREFSWKVFTMTGDVDAYMLYKESQRDDWNEHGVERLDEETPEENEWM